MSPSQRKRGMSRGVASDTGDEDEDDAVFRALASPIRRRMLDVLKASTCTTGELCSAFPDLDRTTVLQHLRVQHGVKGLVGDGKLVERGDDVDALRPLVRGG